jgi:hypothetical protein
MNNPAIAADNGKVFLAFGGKLLRYDANSLKLEAIVSVGAGTVAPISGSGGGTPLGGGTGLGEMSGG